MANSPIVVAIWNNLCQGALHPLPSCAWHPVYRNAGDAQVTGESHDENDIMVCVRAKGTPNRTIRISHEIWDAAAELADSLDETVADVVRESLVGYIELHNDPTWAEARATAKERGDDLSDFILAALRGYIDAGN